MILKAYQDSTQKNIFKLTQDFIASISKVLSKQSYLSWPPYIPTCNTKPINPITNSAVLRTQLQQMQRLNAEKKSDLLFCNQRTGKALSSRIWRDGLLEMLVESGLATCSAEDSNNCRKAALHTAKTLA